MNKKMLRRIMLFPAMAFIASLFFGSLAFSQQDQKFSVSGTVTDKATGQGIQSSIVIFSPDKNAVDKMATNEDGSFSINLPAGKDYRFAAYPWNNDYDMMFYENAKDLSDAKTITLDKDYKDLNFQLAKKPVYNNSVHGIVRNKAGEPVMANVFAMPANKGQMTQYSSFYDKNNPGIFKMSNLLPGDYYLFAQPLDGHMIAGYYRENDIAAQTIVNATVITVTEDGNVSPDYFITLDETQATKTKYEIKGIITEEGEQPLEGVGITITNGLGQVVVPDTDNDLKTDATGSFVIFFEADFPDKYLVTAKKDGYKDAFYGVYLDEKTPGQAVFITMVKIDDTVYKNGIKGVVQNPNGEGIVSKVTVLRVKSDGNYDYNRSEKTAVTDKENPGQFLIENLKPGRYVVFASPAVSGLQSGYYKESGQAVPDVTKATVISVPESGINEDNIVISLPEAEPVQLNFELWGYVTDEHDLPLKDVSITATDASGSDVIINQENLTDNNGMFHLVFKTAGTYSIKAEKQGFIDASGVLTFNDSIPQQKTIIKMYIKTEQNPGQADSKIIAGVNDEIAGNSVQVYPNPVKNSLSISTGQAGVRAEVRVYMITGQAVISETMDTGSGLININTESLNPGSYIVRVNINGKVQATRLLVKE